MPDQARRENALHLRFWLLTGLAFAGVLWVLHGVLLPFVLGIAVAYFLDPVVSRMSRWGWPRWLSALVVLLVFIALVATASVLLYPLLREQVNELITNFPTYVGTLENELWPRVKNVLEHIPNVNIEKLQTSVASYTGDAVNFAGKIVGQVVTGSMAVFDLLAVFLLTPIVAFYLMRDWPTMIRQVDGLLPLRHAAAIHRELHNIDQMIAGFVRGQAMVSVCLALIYSIGLSLAGLKYGMIVGLATGFLSFIPIVGTVAGIVTSLTLAFIQFDSASGILAVASVFVAAQLLDGNFLTPKLVGDRVGLHPVWIIFALLAGAKLFGFVGVLLAVPVAGTLAILIRLGLRVYHRSRYFSPVPPSA